MKKLIYSIVLVVFSIVVFSTVYGSIKYNVYLGQNGYFAEGVNETQSNRLIGVSGVVRNETILPIRIESITPIGGNGIDYFGSVIATWGVSEMTRDEMAKYENLEGKKLSPYSNEEIAIVFQFSDEYAVNPSGYEIVYSVFGIRFSNFIIHN